MLEALGTALGGMGGGLLGQLGGALSAPRRAMWSALGLPDSGAEMMSSITGMDQDNPLLQALGVGAEMVLDPLTLGGMALGGPAARVLAFPWQHGRRLEQTAATLGAGQSAALQDLSLVAQKTAMARASLPQVAADVGRADLPGIAAGATRSYKMAHPDTISAFEAAGLGQGTPTGGLDILGSRLPQGAAVSPLRVNGRMAGSAPAIGPQGIPQMGGWEPNWLMNELAQGNLAPNPADMARQLATERGARALAGRAEPTLGALLGPANQLDPAIAGLPVRQALEEIQYAMPQVASEAARYRLSPLDMGMIGGAGLGSLVGGYLGSKRGY